MSDHQAGRIGVWGASGSGKSSYVMSRIAPLKRVVVFDPMEEYAKALGMKRARSADEIRALMIENWRGFKIAYTPPAAMERRALSQVSALLMLAQKRYVEVGAGSLLTFVVEEMNLSFPLHGATKAPKFAELCSRGRHYGIELIGVSQRVAEVDTRFRGNCSETIVLRQKGEADVKAAALEAGVESSRVRGLPNFRFIQAKADGGVIESPVKRHRR